MNIDTLSAQQGTSSEEKGSHFEPIRILEIELSQPLPVIAAMNEQAGRRYSRAICLIRLHSYPIGMIQLELHENGLAPLEYAPRIWEALQEPINDHLQQDGLPVLTMLDLQDNLSSDIPACIREREQFLASAPFVSVIVPTHDRPDTLEKCLQSLLAVDYPRYEIIIVDNSPTTTATCDLVQQIAQNAPQVRYLREDRRGPSCARNGGIQVAKGEILAFVDDDAVVDRYWLVELVRGFSRADNVACVTGLVLPLELETPAQFWFEEYYGGSWSHQWFNRRILNNKKQRIDMYRPSQFGGGASMAFIATFFQHVHGFDPALGPKSLSQGGEDHGSFFQALMQGYTLVAEPASVIYHEHRRDYTGLRKQIYAYGFGFTAYLMKNIFDHPLLLIDLFIKLPSALSGFLQARATKQNDMTTTYPRELTTLELKGMIYGLLSLSYVRSWWEARNIRRSFAITPLALSEKKEQ